MFLLQNNTGIFARRHFCRKGHFCTKGNFCTRLKTKEKKIVKKNRKYLKKLI